MYYTDHPAIRFLSPSPYLLFPFLKYRYNLKWRKLLQTYFVLLHFSLLHFTSVMYFQTEGKTLHQHKYYEPLYYGALEPNPQYLWDVPILKLYSSFLCKFACLANLSYLQYLCTCPSAFILGSILSHQGHGKALRHPLDHSSLASVLLLALGL